jgi:hypothetical protein
VELLTAPAPRDKSTHQLAAHTPALQGRTPCLIRHKHDATPACTDGLAAPKHAYPSRDSSVLPLSMYIPRPSVLCAVVVVLEWFAAQPGRALAGDNGCHIVDHERPDQPAAPHRHIYYPPRHSHHSSIWRWTPDRHLTCNVCPATSCHIHHIFTTTHPVSESSTVTPLLSPQFWCSACMSVSASSSFWIVNGFSMKQSTPAV